MGARGPQKKPTVLKRLAGNPGKRKLPENEPQPRLVETLVPPDWLDREAVKEFHEKGNELKRIGLLTVLEINLLADYCQCRHLMQLCLRDIEVNGMKIVMQTENGEYQTTNPAFGQYNKLLTQSKQLAAVLGLSAGARASLSPATAKTESKLAAFRTRK